MGRGWQGLERRVNILADKSLLAAFADGTHAVTQVEVKKAVRDSEFHRKRTGMQKMGWIGAAALAAGLVLGLGIHVLLSTCEPDIAPGSPSGGAAAAIPTPPAKPLVSSSSPSASPDPSALKPSAEIPTLAQPLPPERGELARGRFTATQDRLRSPPANH